jgi:two-component system response regulator RegA
VAFVVLVADDAPVARALLGRRLRALGVAFVEAASAAEARAIDATTVACALLDLELGDGSGADVAEALRAACPDVPIAFFSGGASSQDMARALALGKVFKKPDELEDALTWLTSQVRR